MLIYGLSICIGYVWWDNKQMFQKLTEKFGWSQFNNGSASASSWALLEICWKRGNEGSEGLSCFMWQAGLIKIMRNYKQTYLCMLLCRRQQKCSIYSNLKRSLISQSWKYCLRNLNTKTKNKKVICNYLTRKHQESEGIELC